MAMRICLPWPALPLPATRETISLLSGAVCIGDLLEISFVFELATTARHTESDSFCMVS